MGLINGTVTLENNYELWKNMYEKEIISLKEIFKDEDFIYEHVGSTSVKGLPAKPIVDIAIGVNSLNDIDKYLDKLSKIYTVKPNTEREEILLIKETTEETFFLIHIIPKNNNSFIDLIRFRDILNNNPDVLNEYKNLKTKLSKEYPNDRKMYTKSKNDFIQSILKNTNNC